MKAIHFHGALGKEFGELRVLDVASPAEALRAIEAQTNRLYQYFYDGDKRGIAYRVVIGNEEVQDIPELTHEYGDDKVSEIHFYPVPRGGGGVLKIIIGVILIIVAIIISIYSQQWETVGEAVSYLASGQATGWAFFFAAAGASMVVGGIAQLIIGTPKLGEVDTATQQPSYYFNGVENNMRQGGPIPIGYGQMIVGSQVISLAIRTQKLAVDAVWTDSDGPTTTINGGGVGNVQEGGPYQVDGNNYRKVPIVQAN